MSKTDYLELEVLKWCCSQANALGATPTTYVALYTTTPTESAAGVETSYGGYARQGASGKFAAPAAGSVANNAAITFPVVASGTPTIVGCALCDAVSAGNILRWQTITGIAFAVNDQPNFPIGSITFTED